MFSKNASTVVDEVFLYLHKLMEQEKLRNETVEKRAVQLTFNPTEEYLDYGNSRPASREYIQNELDWYKSYDLCIKGHKGIENNQIWQKCATDSGYVNSNYGYLAIDIENGLQLANSIHSLLIDKYSRQSVIIYNRPEMHRQSRDGIHANSDFTCTMYTQQFITEDDTLDMIVNMRSNDAIFGLQNDYSWQRYIYFEIYKVLSKYYETLKIGKIIWQAGSIHVYKRHFNLLKEIVEEYGKL